MWRAQRLAQASAGRILRKTPHEKAGVVSCGRSKRAPHLTLLATDCLDSLNTATRRGTVHRRHSSRAITAFSTRTREVEEEGYNHHHANTTTRKELVQPQQHGEEQDIRQLFQTLRAISMAVPKRLAAAPASPRASSWRDAAAFEEYRDPGNFHDKNNNKWKKSTAAVVEEQDDWESDMQDAITESNKKQQQQQQQQQQHKSSDHGELFANIALEEDMERDSAVKNSSSSSARAVTNDSTSNKTTAPQILSFDEPFVTDEEYDELSLVEVIEKELSNTIKEKKVDDAIQLFELATVQHGTEISMDVVKDLFQLLSYHRPFHCYQMLQYILERTNDTSIFTKNNNNDDDDNDDVSGVQEEKLGGTESHEIGKLYRRMCFSLRLLDPHSARHGDIRSLVGSVVSDLRQLDETVERMCLPVLVTSLVEQRSSNVGRWALHYYNRMASQSYDLAPEYFMHLLTCSKYNRQNDLPYHDILRQVVLAGKRPFPHIVMNALENMFPYTENVEATYIALQSVMELQRQSVQRGVDQRESRIRDAEKLAQEQDPEKIRELKRKIGLYRQQHSYIIDISSLESIAAASARTGSVELNLLLWDALDVMGHQPTESIYESTIVCFAQNDDLWENAFVVLNDMEDKGFVPSRALIKGFSTSLRANFMRLEMANDMLHKFLMGHPDAIPFTPTALNVLMSAFAERGNVDNTLNLLDEFYKNDFSPNVDSFSFALEAVGKATARMVKNEKLRIAPQKKQRTIETYLSATDSILTQMEKARGPDGKAIAPSVHVIRNYVEFLCLANQIETATSVVQDFLENSSELKPNDESVIDNKIILRVAVANAEIGDFETARRLAASTSEPLPFMDTKIDKIEERILQNGGRPYDGASEGPPRRPETSPDPSTT